MYVLNNFYEHDFQAILPEISGKRNIFTKVK